MTEPVVTTAHICRECKDGKHINCDGVAWNNDLDAVTDCECGCAAVGGVS